MFLIFLAALLTAPGTLYIALAPWHRLAFYKLGVFIVAGIVSFFPALIVGAYLPREFFQFWGADGLNGWAFLPVILVGGVIGLEASVKLFGRWLPYVFYMGCVATVVGLTGMVLTLIAVISYVGDSAANEMNQLHLLGIMFAGGSVMALVALGLAHPLLKRLVKPAVA